MEKATCASSDARVKRKKIIPNKIPAPEQDPVKRRSNFEEVNLGYTPEMAVKEAIRCLNCSKPGCVEGCPVNVRIPEFISKIKEGNFKGAIEIITDKNLLPAVCGRVCPQEDQCEKRCTLGKKHEPVAIGLLERFAADWQMQNGLTGMHMPDKSTGKKAAVVGSGPSGLTCAYDLSRLGHKVAIFEALHEAGGVLVYGIPEFRLPKKVVAWEIASLRDMGVEIITNAVVGRLISIDEIMESFDACFIGTGAGLPKFMGIEGENLNGVYSANEFLTRINLMRGYRFPEYDTPVKAGQRVAVIGGGNVAVDSARTALRLGAKEVTIIYRRSAIELPARADEVRHAKEEGIGFEFCASPLRITGKDGWVNEIECIRMSLCEPDEKGRKRPLPLKGTEFRIPADIVVMAIGADANPLVPRSTSTLQLDKHGYIIADASTGLTSRQGVYAGGDIVTGSATVISAMGAGRKAAKAINEYLRSHSARL